MADLRIAQSEDYKGDDWWEWAVWVDGPVEVLDRIRLVEYTLHPTFPHPVRRVRDRASNFKLETAGWGGFTIYARVVLGDDSEVRLEHELGLHYPDGRRTAN